jgi:hypothetical protein
MYDSSKRSMGYSNRQQQDWFRVNAMAQAHDILHPSRFILQQHPQHYTAQKTNYEFWTIQPARWKCRQWIWRRVVQITIIHVPSMLYTLSMDDKATATEKREAELLLALNF